MIGKYKVCSWNWPAWWWVLQTSVNAVRSLGYLNNLPNIICLNRLKLFQSVATLNDSRRFLFVWSRLLTQAVNQVLTRKFHCRMNPAVMHREHFSASSWQLQPKASSAADLQCSPGRKGSAVAPMPANHMFLQHCLFALFFANTTTSLCVWYGIVEFNVPLDTV